ncbi:outer membrane protein [Roseovarius sp. EL26]|uniref:outer membrane protein n=1 Tax=Roseovarius sp. EL26 TaxID=2126672 RepID=UPI000EA31CF3|nr:hypothetical protein [Roseovarius sp. EL26]
MRLAKAIRSSAVLAVTAITIVSANIQAAAANPLSSAGNSSNDWHYSFTPYLYLPTATEGTSTIDGSSAGVDLDLGDILDILQGALSARFEAWKGQFGIISEGYFTYLEEDATLPGPVGANLEVTAKQAFISLMGAYRFHEGRTSRGRYSWDVSGGVRWNSITQDIDITGTSRAISVGGTETWFEPAIGLRAAYELSEDWTAGARVELSGFGVNGNDLQYTVLTGFDWQAWENVSLKFGYQWYGIDFATNRSSGRFAYDIDQHGPYLGASFTW